jgi:hypothetical protein
VALQFTGDRAHDGRYAQVLGRAALRDFIIRGCVRDQRQGFCPVGEYPVWVRRMMTEALAQLSIALSVPQR